MLFDSIKNSQEICRYGYSHILLHVPHSAKLKPLGDVHDYLTDEFRDLTIFSSDLIDWYTDDLFVPAPNSFLMKKDNQIVSDPPITALVFDVCRTLCDVERLTKDPLEEKGLGIIYKSDYTDKLEKSKIDFLKRRYLDHQCKIASDIMTHSKSLLIDCHSFSSRPNVLHPDADIYDADICIGYNEDGTRPNNTVIDYIVNYFRSQGYKIGVNIPFSNSKTADSLSNYHSVKIEVRKSLYMNEQTLEKNDNYNKVKKDIQGLYRQLLETSGCIDSVFYENYVLFSTYVVGPKEKTKQRSLRRILFENRPQIMAGISFPSNNIMATESIEERIQKKRICTETNELPFPDEAFYSPKNDIGDKRSCEEDLNDILALCILKRDIKYIIPYLDEMFYITLNIKNIKGKKFSFILDKSNFLEMMTQDFPTMDKENISVYYALHNDHTCDTSRVLVARQSKKDQSYNRESYKLSIENGKIKSMRYMNNFVVSKTMYYDW